MMWKPVLPAASLAMVIALAVPVSAQMTVPVDPARGVPSLAPIVRQITPAVVNIATKTRVPAAANPLYSDPFFRRFLDAPQQLPEREMQSAGSGVIIDAAQGHVLTNSHVIDKADEIWVTLRDNRRLKAELIGQDPGTDVALLKIPTGGLSALRLGDSAQLEIGDFVIAVGNPFGIGQTVTYGIVSALSRTGFGIEGYEDFIQTDASINPGNSGGAMVNMRGELVGINTAIIGPAGGSVGIGFAVPINMARSVVDQISRFGSVQRGRLGIEIQDLTPDLIQSLGTAAREGAVITKVEPNSPAARAGILAGDVVVAVNRIPIHTSSQLRNTVGLTRAGEQVELSLIRGAQAFAATARVEQIEEPKEASLPPPAQRLAGAVFGAIPRTSPHFGKRDGVAVTTIEQRSPAWTAGLRAGDIVTMVNRKPVKTAQELKQAAAANGGATIALNVLRREAEIVVILR